MDLSPKLGFGWVQVPAHGFESQSVVNGVRRKGASGILFPLSASV